MPSRLPARVTACLAACLAIVAADATAQDARTARLDWIEVAGNAFVHSGSREHWVPHGFNYTTTSVDGEQRLIEEVWEDEWDTIVGDFEEMAQREANLVRYHMQLPTYLIDRNTIDERALDRLERLAQLADDNSLYLMLVGLAVYRPSADPDWYVALGEQARWDVQALFWHAVAERLAPYSSVMAYDLINEPAAVTTNGEQTEWWTGNLDGLRFVQRINLDGNGRTAVEIAESWTNKMIDSIRSVDERHLITIGNLPFPRSAFGPENAGRLLDFASPHLYPNTENQTIVEAVAAELDLTAAFAVMGKPVLVGETFPLRISGTGLEYFVRAARQHAAGFVSHYFGRTEDEDPGDSLAAAVQAAALAQWIRLGPLLKQPSPERIPLYRYSGPFDRRYDTSEEARGFGYQRDEHLGDLMSYQDGTGRALCEGVDPDAGRYSLYADCALPDDVEFVRILGWMPPAGDGTAPVFRYRGEAGELLTRARNDEGMALLGFAYAGELGRVYSAPPAPGPANRP